MNQTYRSNGNNSIFKHQEFGLKYERSCRYRRKYVCKRRQINQRSHHLFLFSLLCYLYCGVYLKIILQSYETIHLRCICRDSNLRITKFLLISKHRGLPLSIMLKIQDPKD